MCTREPAWRVAALCFALSAACGGSGSPAESPVVAAVKPACGDNGSTTSVIVEGTLPVKPEVWLSDPARNQVDTTYRAWIGEFELDAVEWRSSSELAALVPAGLPVGTYGLTLESPYGTRATREAAFQVRAGLCPIETAAIVVTNPVASPATATVGQDMTVTATVQNNGQAAALGVLGSVVSAPAGLTWRSGPGSPQDIPSGQARTFTWTYTATAAGGGVFVLAAAGSAADTGLPVAAPAVNTNDVLVSVGTFLTANTMVTPGQATLGQLVTVVLTATNHTTAAVLATPSIVVTGPVTAGYSPAPQSIPAGSSLAFQWTFTANAVGLASFTASVSGTNPGSGTVVTVPTAQVDVTVQGVPALTATLAIPPSIELGDFTVTMLVSNSGGATSADVVEVVPDTPTLRAGSSSTVAMTSGPTGAPATVVAGQPAVTFTWTFTATSPGSLSLTSTARGKDANTGASLSSAAAPSNEATVGLHTLGGTVTGLAGGGLVLRNGSDDLAVPAGATSFLFPVPVATGATYAVTVLAQPSGPSQACTVANGSGTVGAANVTTVAISCTTNSFTVGGAVSGLSGTGLVLHNGTDDLPIPAGATSFVLPASVLSGATYAVTVTTQPTTPSQICTVSNGAGTVGAANVTNVNVTCARRTFSLGGTVTGLAGTGLVLLNGTDSLPVASNGAFTFPSPVASGATYSVTVGTAPTNPSQACTVTNGSGTVGAANVTNVSVACVTNSFTVGGTITGLAGSGLVLRNNGIAAPAIPPGATSYVFPTSILSGGTYSVTIGVQPSNPTQACTVTNGTGTVGAANVTNVNVICATSSFTVGGTVSGLTGSGLVLLDNGVPLPAIPAGATSYTLPASVPSGTGYAITVGTQPTGPSQACTVANGTGTVGAANVTNVNVSCATSSFTVGGTVSGLAGTGLVLRTGTQSLSITANGPFTFSTPIASGAGYSVTVTTQPSGPTQTCTVANGSGTVGAANVTNVSVSCSTSSFTVGGTVSGLTGTGLVLHNGSEDLPVAANGSFTFATAVASGGAYAVSVTTQPSGPTQACTVTNGSGTVGAANVTNVAVTCSTSSFTVGGTVSGLTGTGLVLHNGAENLPVAANGAFTFATAVASGGSYAVTVTTQPSGPTQACTVTNGSGTVGAANVTNVAVTCSTSSFTVGGTVSGLTGTGLVLLNNGVPLPAIAPGATSYTLPAPVPSGTGYAITVGTQPSTPSQTCTVANGTGTVGAANVTNVNVTCATRSFTVGGTVSGLAGTGLVLRTGTQSLSISANGPFTFPTPIASGGSYSVTVTTQPSGPTQTCTVANGSGTVGAANVTNVAVSCTTSSFTVGGTLSGLLGTGLVLHNGSEDLPVAANGSFTFSTPIASGAGYAVSVTTQPSGPTQSCTVTNGSGTIGAGNVTNVSVTCSTSSFTVGGTVTGLTGTGLVLRNGTESLTILADGPFTFATPIASGDTYSVRVQSQPGGQACTVTGGDDASGGGPVVSGNVTSIVVTCLP